MMSPPEASLVPQPTVAHDRQLQPETVDVSQEVSEVHPALTFRLHRRTLRPSPAIASLAKSP